jgi:hypothetical protein
MMLYQLILIFTLHIFFLFLVILPLALAFEMLSIDVQEIKHFFTTITYPVNAVENYLKLAGIATLNSFFYLTYTEIIIVIIIGGTLGTLRNSLKIKNYKISFISFLKEGGSLVFPFSGILSLATVITTACALIGIALVQTDTDKVLWCITPQYYHFYDTFIFILPLVLLVSIVLFIFILSVYSTVGVVVNKQGTFKSMGKSLSLFNKRPFVMSFFSFLVLFFITLNFGLSIIALSYNLTSPGFDLIPGFSSILCYLADIYLFTLICASILSSYIRLCSPV